MLKVDSTPSLSEYLSYYPSHIVYRSLAKKPKSDDKFSEMLEKELDNLMSGNKSYFKKVERKCPDSPGPWCPDCKIYTKCTHGRREDECQK